MLSYSEYGRIHEPHVILYNTHHHLQGPNSGVSLYWQFHITKHIYIYIEL